MQSRVENFLSAVRQSAGRLLAPWDLPRWRRRVGSFLELPSYLVLVAGISTLNAFLPFFPIELFLVLRTLVRPKEWWKLSGLAALCSALGAACLAYLIELHPHTEIVAWLSQRLGEANWDHVSQFVQQRGALGLVLISMSFLPLPPAVAVCVLSKVPAAEIALAIGVGNFAKYSAFSWIAAFFPARFGKTAT